MSIVYNSNIKSLPILHKGKVRDNYIVDENHLLMVTTDRISAFDVILGEPIPHKGKVLNQMSLFWFDLLKDITPNHLTNIAPSQVVADTELHLVRNRSVVVKKLKPILIEAVVRGYMSGSGWKDYKKTGQICGIILPDDMRNSQKFEEPIFTPAAKAEIGQHDENISFAKMQNLIGSELADKIKEKSIELYAKARDFALTRGIIVADTKFEFGLDENNNLILMDEIITPDSSRFWAIDSYTIDSNPPSFDKQFIRDWLETQSWNKSPPAPIIPQDIQEKTAAKYQEAFLRITGKTVNI